jgi:exonuclease VII large subunit
LPICIGDWSPARATYSKTQNTVSITSREFCACFGPVATLRRGYSITLDERGTIVRTIAAVRPNMKIRTRVSDGEFGSEILPEEDF